MSEQAKNSQDKLKEVFANLEIQAKELKKKLESKADFGESDCCNSEDDCQNDFICNSIDNLYLMIYNLRDYVYQSDGELWNALDKHKQNHVPPLNADAMAKFLKSVGLEGSYDIQKPTIWISTARNGSKTFNVNLKAKINEISK